MSEDTVAYTPLAYETSVTPSDPGPRPEDPCLCGNTAWGIQAGVWVCGAGHVATTGRDHLGTDDFPYQADTNETPNLDEIPPYSEVDAALTGLRVVETLDDLPEWARKTIPTMVLPPSLVAELRECQHETARIEQRRMSLFRGYCHAMSIDLSSNSASYNLDDSVVVVTVTPNDG